MAKRESPLTREDLYTLIKVCTVKYGPSPDQITDALIHAFGGRRIPQQKTKADRERAIRDEAIRRYVWKTKDTYKGTATRFGCSVATVKRACSKDSDPYFGSR